jgi:predicted CoA-binding protein
MVTKAIMDDFLAQEAFAIVGVSRNPRKFGTIVYRNLKRKGFDVIPVNPKMDSIDGEPCYPDLKSLPKPVGGIVVVVPPERTEQVVKDAKEAGITRVWLQQGAESKAAIKYCEDNGMSVVHGHCIMMFTDPTGFHKFHRWLWGVFGKIPK